MASTRHSAFLRLMLSNPVFANIVMVVLLGGMVVGSVFMVRESFPDFKLDMVQVTVPYPSADPEEIEEGILLPIEDALEGLQGVKRLYTTASEGVGTAIVEASESTDIDRLKEDIKSRVDTITTFPADAEQPIIEDIKFKAMVINLAVWGDLPERQLKELAYEIKDELLVKPGISQIEISGTRDYEISIEVSEEKLRQYGLSFADIADVVRRSSVNLPGGTVRTSAEDLKIRAVGRRYWAAAFHDIIIRANPDGSLVRLTDLATIHDTFDDDTEAFALFNGHRALNISVNKTSEEDSVKIADTVRKYVAAKQATLPPTVHLTTWFDASRLIKDRISMLTRNGLIGLALVFLALGCFLNLRLGFWVTLGIPISLGGAMAIMTITGQSLNMISLFAMIMVLGIIVDDAIVVGESIHAKQKLGLRGEEAAVEGTREVFWSVIAAVLTTMVAFLPLLFVSGIIGKFIAVMPGPVIAALGISLCEALWILPVHLRHGGRDEPVTGFSWRHPHRWFIHLIARVLDWWIERVYGPSIDLLLRWRYAAIAGACALLLAMVGLVSGGFIKQEFFPSSDDDFIRARIELPQGVPISETERVTRQILDGWQKTDDLYRGQLGGKPLAVAVYSVTGGTVGTGNEPPRTGNFLTEVFIELQPAEERNIYFEEIVDRWRQNTGPIQGAVATNYGGMGGGPPGGNVNLDLLCPDEDRLVQASEDLKERLAKYQGVYDINSTYKPGKRELRLQLKPEARPLGLTLQDLAAQVRAGFYGAEVMRIQRNRDEVRIMVRYIEDERATLGQLDAMRIRTPTGLQVPFHDVAIVDRQAGYATIRRQERMRVIGVSAEVDKSGNSSEIMSNLLASYIPRLEEKYRITARRGYDEQMRLDSVTSMRIGAIAAMIGIYLIMATIFKSYLQPLIIMVTIPLGMIGAFVGHLIYGLPLSMMSFFGMVALTGIVVNDAIVLIVGVNERMATGMGVFESLREGGKRRFRAIMLTTLTTFAGLFPIILEKSFQAQFLIPMAISIAFGVVFATSSTLIVIPCLVAALNDLRRVAFLARHLRWPTREEAEFWGRR